jgi:hypothetical protein
MHPLQTGAATVPPPFIECCHAVQASVVMPRGITGPPIYPHLVAVHCKAAREIHQDLSSGYFSSAGPIATGYAKSFVVALLAT